MAGSGSWRLSPGGVRGRRRRGRVPARVVLCSISQRTADYQPLVALRHLPSCGLRHANSPLTCGHIAALTPLATRVPMRPFRSVTLGNDLASTHRTNIEHPEFTNRVV